MGLFETVGLGLVFGFTGPGHSEDVFENACRGSDWTQRSQRRSQIHSFRKGPWSTRHGNTHSNAHVHYSANGAPCCHVALAPPTFQIKSSLQNIPTLLRLKHGSAPLDGLPRKKNQFLSYTSKFSFSSSSSLFLVQDCLPLPLQKYVKPLKHSGMDPSMLAWSVHMSLHKSSSWLPVKGLITPGFTAQDHN